MYRACWSRSRRPRASHPIPSQSGGYRPTAHFPSSPRGQGPSHAVQPRWGVGRRVGLATGASRLAAECIRKLVANVPGPELQRPTFSCAPPGTSSSSLHPLGTGSRLPIARPALLFTWRMAAVVPSWRMQAVNGREGSEGTDDVPRMRRTTSPRHHLPSTPLRVISSAPVECIVGVLIDLGRAKICFRRERAGWRGEACRGVC